MPSHFGLSVSLPWRGDSEWSVVHGTCVLTQVSPFLLYTMQLKTTNLRHTVLPGGLLTGSFPIQVTCKDKCETRHCKATHERRVKCFTLASTYHLEDILNKPEFESCGFPPVPDYSV